MKGKTLLPANTKFNKDDSVGFLISEYEQCFDQMRHYDNVGISFIRFAFTGFVVLTSGTFALFKYLEGVTYQHIFIGGILLLAFSMGLIMLTLMVRNRVYFVEVVRQVNSLRNYFLNNMEMDFIKYNVCYTDPSFPRAFSLWSTYTLLFTMVTILNGTLGGVGSYLVITYAKETEDAVSWVIGLVIAIALVLAQLIAVAYYLRKHDRLEPNNKVVAKESAKENNSG